MAADIEIQAREILSLRHRCASPLPTHLWPIQTKLCPSASVLYPLSHRLNKILCHHTGQSLETIEKTVDRDFFMDAQASKEFGVIDEVITLRTKSHAETTRTIGVDKTEKL